MKLLLLTFALALSLNQQQPPTSADPQPTPTPLSKKEIEARRKAEAAEDRRRRKQYEAEEKERLKRPAEIRITAPSDRVGAILVRHMNNGGYQIAEEGKYRLIFQREVTGFKVGLAGAMMGGDSPPLWTVSYTLTELSGETVITADMAVIVRRRFGTPNRKDMNRHKESRQDLEALLQAVKIEAESK